MPDKLHVFTFHLERLYRYIKCKKVWLQICILVFPFVLKIHFFWPKCIVVRGSRGRTAVHVVVVVKKGHQVSLVKFVCGNLENRKIWFHIISVLNVWYFMFFCRQKYVAEGQVLCSLYSHLLLSLQKNWEQFGLHFEYRDFLFLLDTKCQWLMRE